MLNCKVDFFACECILEIFRNLSEYFILNALCNIKLFVVKCMNNNNFFSWRWILVQINILIMCHVSTLVKHN